MKVCPFSCNHKYVSLESTKYTLCADIFFDSISTCIKYTLQYSSSQVEFPVVGDRVLSSLCSGQMSLLVTHFYCGQFWAAAFTFSYEPMLIPKCIVYTDEARFWNVSVHFFDKAISSTFKFWEVLLLRFIDWRIQICGVKTNATFIFQGTLIVRGRITLPKLNIAPEKLPSQKESSLQPYIFRGYVKLRVCKPQTNLSLVLTVFSKLFIPNSRRNCPLVF